MELKLFGVLGYKTQIIEPAHGSPALSNTQKILILLRSFFGKLIFCVLYTFQVKAALPPSSSKCPLCHQKHVNPVTTSISGFVFCYKCLWNYIDKFHCCPITYRHCNLEDMIRINLQWNLIGVSKSKECRKVNS